MPPAALVLWQWSDTESTLSKVQKCRICGFVSPEVRVGIWKDSKGRYYTILRCSDHLACDSRKDAI